MPNRKFNQRDIDYKLNHLKLIILLYNFIQNQKENIKSLYLFLYKRSKIESSIHQLSNVKVSILNFL